jgi:hypothetical protein
VDILFCSTNFVSDLANILMRSLFGFLELLQIWQPTEQHRGSSLELAVYVSGHEKGWRILNNLRESKLADSNIASVRRPKQTPSDIQFKHYITRLKTY